MRPSDDELREYLAIEVEMDQKLVTISVMRPVFVRIVEELLERRAGDCCTKAWMKGVTEGSATE